MTGHSSHMDLRFHAYEYYQLVVYMFVIGMLDVTLSGILTLIVYIASMYLSIYIFTCLCAVSLILDPCIR